MIPKTPKTKLTPTYKINTPFKKKTQHKLLKLNFPNTKKTKNISNAFSTKKKKLK